MFENSSLRIRRKNPFLWGKLVPAEVQLGPGKGERQGQASRKYTFFLCQKIHLCRECAQLPAGSTQAPGSLGRDP